jgi:hypothetical protein
MILYRPEAFEPLVDTPWSELCVRTAIRDIIQDTDSAFRGPRPSLTLFSNVRQT